MNKLPDIQTARAILDLLSGSARMRSGSAEYAPEWIVARLTECGVKVTLGAEGDEITFGDKVTMRLEVYGDDGKPVTRVHSLDLAYTLYAYCFGERLVPRLSVTGKEALMSHCLRKFRERLEQRETDERTAA